MPADDARAREAHGPHRVDIRSPRTTRTLPARRRMKIGAAAAPMAIIAFVRPAPRKAASAIARIREGIAREAVGDASAPHPRCRRHKPGYQAQRHADGHGEGDREHPDHEGEARDPQMTRDSTSLRDRPFQTNGRPRAPAASTPIGGGGIVRGRAAAPGRPWRRRETRRSIKPMRPGWRIRRCSRIGPASAPPGKARVFIAGPADRPPRRARSAGDLRHVDRRSRQPFDALRRRCSRGCRPNRR